MVALAVAAVAAGPQVRNAARLNATAQRALLATEQGGDARGRLELLARLEGRLGNVRAACRDFPKRATAENSVLRAGTFSNGENPDACVPRDASKRL